MRTKFRVRYKETDRMGIVYHSNYIVWFDVGRTELLRNLGFDYRHLEEIGLMLPVVEVNVRYKSPSYYDDLVEIEATILEVSRVKIKFGYKVYRGETLLAEGYTVHGFTDKNLKPIALNKFNQPLYEILINNAERN
ncbi:thioesterase family protein [Caloramator sp. mosi_1]|uniref:acyl-CoA thioesterase n=1 Tax=Caloramator sp. mosi_1 TaxID=3023090 RepID=UPI00235EE22A|nr:thioesterase family protein [Caloramator sp. mosi_1]WDC84629.1 thioesterase family protein [Caloramator sp. mosi_1]